MKYLAINLMMATVEVDISLFDKYLLKSYHMLNRTPLVEIHGEGQNTFSLEFWYKLNNPDSKIILIISLKKLHYLEKIIV